MSRERESLPRPLRRALLTEAGHRCAIPTCRSTHGLQIHHIVEHANGGSDDFANLIVLCANCHSRVTAGEIDRKAVQHYKENLAVINGRYSDLEVRALRQFADQGGGSGLRMLLPGGLDLLMSALVEDGIVTRHPSSLLAVSDAFGNTVLFGLDGQVDPSTPILHEQVGYELTERGAVLVDAWTEGQRLD